MVLMAAAAAAVLPQLAAAQSILSPGLSQEQVCSTLLRITPSNVQNGRKAMQAACCKPYHGHASAHPAVQLAATPCQLLALLPSFLLQANQLAGFWRYQNRTQGTFCLFGTVWDEIMAEAAAAGADAINVNQARDRPGTMHMPLARPRAARLHGLLANELPPCSHPTSNNPCRFWQMQ